MNTSLGWRTRDQLLQMYHGNVDMVNGICQRKAQLGLTREHPDLPTEEMRLYYVPCSYDC